jgi:hypothetical protein
MEPILELLQKAVSVGFDSLLAGIAIGPIMLSGRGRALFSILLGVCDGLATLLGALTPHRLPAPPAAALYLLAVLLIVQGARHNRSWFLAIPLLLGLDNFAVGGTIAEAPFLALSSATMGAIGIALSALVCWMISRIWATEAVI